MMSINAGVTPSMVDWIRRQASDQVGDVPIVVARHAWDRFWGLMRCRDTTALVLPGCQAIHRWMPTGAFRFGFFDHEGNLIREGSSSPFGLYWEPDAAQVVEVRLGQGCRKPPEGFSMIEGLLMLPLMLMLALGLTQLMLVGLASLIVQYAASEAARQGALEGGRALAIDRGLARGLAPIWFDLEPAAEREALLTVAGAAGRYAMAKAQGQITWSIVSPTAATFEDWAHAGTGVIRPPAWVQPDTIVPSSGAVAGDDGLAIGRRSQVHYIDAASLKIRVSVGVPLIVLVAGPAIAKALRVAQGCGSVDFRRECLLLSGRLAFGPPTPMIGLSATGISIAQSPLLAANLGR